MDTTRRTMLATLGMGLVLRPAAALADRIRVLPGEATTTTPAGFPGQGDPAFQRYMAGIRVDAGASDAGVRVFWLGAGVPVPPLPVGVATLDEARARGQLTVTEREQASVPDLTVENHGKSYVLLMAGEILVGGKQNRVLREDVLLPPRSGPRALGVYCVEAGRWDTGRRDFESRSTFAAPRLRSTVMERADQQRVWAEVDRYAGAAAAPSPTRSYQAIYDKPEVKERLERTGRAPALRPPAGAVGAAAFVGKGLAGLDVFHEADLFARQWPKLLRALALEALRQPPVAEVDEAILRTRVEAVVAAAARATGVVRGNAGVGQVFEFRLDGLRGAALTFEGRTLHAAVV